MVGLVVVVVGVEAGVLVYILDDHEAGVEEEDAGGGFPAVGEERWRVGGEERVRERWVRSESWVLGDE